MNAAARDELEGLLGDDSLLQEFRAWYADRANASPWRATDQQTAFLYWATVLKHKTAEQTLRLRFKLLTQ